MTENFDKSPPGLFLEGSKICVSLCDRDNFASCWVLHCRVAGDVVAGVIIKCLNARPKTKEKGINIILMYIEVEKQDIVQVSSEYCTENQQYYYYCYYW